MPAWTPRRGSARSRAALFAVTALAWLAVIEGRRPSAWDVAGGALAIAGMVVIALGARREGAR
jgi:drug/metabolite transporter superfamily protein YnfA